MATPTVRDQLLADVELTRHRLEEMSEALDEADDETREALTARVGAISARSDALAEQIREWPELRVGTSGAVRDLSAAVDTLEADVDAAQEAGRDRYRSLVDRQLRTWRGRAEHLQLQSTLGAMEARDDLESVASRLNEARAGILLELRNVAHDTKDAVVDLRDNVEEVLADVRHAVERAADALVHGKD